MPLPQLPAGPPEVLFVSHQEMSAGPILAKLMNPATDQKYLHDRRMLDLFLEGLERLRVLTQCRKHQVDLHVEQLEKLH